MHAASDYARAARRATSLKRKAPSSMIAPDRVDLDQIMLAVMKVIYVAAGLLHEHALDQLAACKTVALASTWY